MSAAALSQKQWLSVCSGPRSWPEAEEPRGDVSGAGTREPGASREVWICTYRHGGSQRPLSREEKCAEQRRGMDPATPTLEDHVPRLRAEVPHSPPATGLEGSDMAASSLSLCTGRFLRYVF